MDLCTYIERRGSEIVEETDGFSRTFCFTPDFPGFDGHFPGNPILPGVIQTLLGETSSLSILNMQFPHESFVLTSVTRCKFLRPIKPDENISLGFNIKNKQEKHISICKITVKNEIAASYQLIFSPEVKS
ncbi:3-hydroxyacyl-ACP dehydratase FabZ family protein [Maridesulfovibrio zosterae]|uniref:3-hydroxyacyl-ACP dehydratase FabZ family protein n=1 Tax=Maridesulfovibrio zosterae TaxID=82171 RepID=UPI0004878EB1|nr:3-hydroxyacyl-ACP dehydratase [Maridesulfovibrio zosterae]